MTGNDRLDHAKALAAGVAAAKKLLAGFPIPTGLQPLGARPGSHGNAIFQSRGKIRLDEAGRTRGWFTLNGARLRVQPD